MNNNWDGVNILVILPQWFRTFVNNNVGKVLSELYTQGANIHLYCGPSVDDHYFNEFLPDAKLHAHRDVTSTVRSFIGLIRLIAATRIDMVLWTYSGYRENLLLSLLRLFGGPRLVIKSDSAIPRKCASFKSCVGNMLFNTFPAKQADMLIAETEDVKNYAKKYYKTDNIYMMPNGVPLTYFKKLYGLFVEEPPPLKHPYILYTGRICREKGIDLLIESFSMIADKAYDWNLAIVGVVWDEAYDGMVKKMVAEKKLEHRITFHSPAFGEDLYRWYHFAEFFVLPSRDEGLANRIPEAMFFRNPVVAFDVGQTRSMVNSEVGVLVPKGDIHAFAEAMLDMASDEQKRKKLGEKANSIIETDYNDEVLIPQLLRKCSSYL